MKYEKFVIFWHFLLYNGEVEGRKEVFFGFVEIFSGLEFCFHNNLYLWCNSVQLATHKCTKPEQQREAFKWKNMDICPFSLQSSFIFLNCSARLSQINTIFVRFFSCCNMLLTNTVNQTSFKFSFHFSVMKIITKSLVVDI